MLDITENNYKPDFEIADKYINFSSELLRLSLLAITGIGALIMYTFKGDSNLHLTLFDKYRFFTALIFFSLAAGTSMFHRFYASDSLSYHIAYLRKKTKDEKDGRTKALKKAEMFLIITEYLFGIAIVIFGIAILKLLINN